MIDKEPKINSKLGYVSFNEGFQASLVSQIKVWPLLYSLFVEETSSAMAEIDDGPHGARTLHKGSTINVNAIPEH